jgi:hypothetical protein
VPLPPDAAIAFELMDVDKRKVTAGGVTAAKLPQDRRNSRRSLVVSFRSDATGTSIGESFDIKLLNNICKLTLIIQYCSVDR